jgi:two-component sensor histidine kinase
MQLVHLLTDQLGGELTVHRANPTAFVLRFPINKSL